MDDVQNCVFVGENAGLEFKKGKNCVFIGNNTGSKVIEADNLILIGNDIHTRFPEDNEDCMFLGENVVIKKDIFKLLGLKINHE